MNEQIFEEKYVKRLKYIISDRPEIDHTNQADRARVQDSKHMHLFVYPYRDLLRVNLYFSVFTND